MAGQQSAPYLAGQKKADSILYPWCDRSGAVSPLKLSVFIGLFVPAAWLAVQAVAGWLGSKPLTEAIHQSGDWAVRFLLLSLLITPLRSVAAWPKLILVRRMLGLAALAYVLLHVALYVALEAFDLNKVASEIILRLYLTIGFVALVGLTVLGATSTDGMIRRLGSMRWNRLHATVYAIAVLALVHFAMQRKLEVSEPVLMAGFFLWLMAFRFMKRRDWNTGPLALAGLAVITGLATAFIEYAWYATMTGVPAHRVFLANFDFSYEIRPAWWALSAALCMAVLAALRAHALPRRQAPQDAKPSPLARI